MNQTIVWIENRLYAVHILWTVGVLLYFEHRSFLFLVWKIIRLYERCYWHLAHSIRSNHEEKKNSHWKSVTNWFSLSLSLGLSVYASNSTKLMIVFFVSLVFSNRKIVWIKLTSRIWYKLFSAYLTDLWRKVEYFFQLIKKVAISPPQRKQTKNKTKYV